MEKIRCKAFGKINLTLDVLGKRADGYHEILTLFQGISLFDEVRLTRANNEGLVLTCDVPSLSTGSDNLAYQAAQLMQEKFPQIKGLTIELKKRIPLAAGLAGGSADAATVIWGLDRLYELNLAQEELVQLAARLGSDVPFCLYPLTAIGAGRGERLSFCPPCPELWLVLLKPPFGVSTKEVYSNLSQVKITRRPRLDQVIQGLKATNKEMIYASLGNVLEESTFALYPQLKIWAEEISALNGVKKVIMAGSGPTLMAFVDNSQAAKKLTSSLKKPNWSVEVVRTITGEDLVGRMMSDE